MAGKACSTMVSLLPFFALFRAPVGQYSWLRFLEHDGAGAVRAEVHGVDGAVVRDRDAVARDLGAQAIRDPFDLCTGLRRAVMEDGHARRIGETLNPLHHRLDRL